MDPCDLGFTMGVILGGKGTTHCVVKLGRRKSLGEGCGYE
jgi:hypothetical protein